MSNKLNIDWNDFLTNYWQKKPVILRDAFSHFVDPITPDELAGLAMEEEIDSRIVTNKDGKWDAKFGPFIDFSNLGEDHWSLLVQAVDHWHEQAATLVEPFKCIPQWQFEDLMISYATQGAGVGPHIDNYDVFIIQGMGCRRWQVGDRNPNYKQFSAHKALLHVESYQPIIDEEITAGDILYIPIGFPHNGVSIGESLSYSVGFRTQTSQELLSGFADYVIDNLPNGIFYQDPDLKLPKDPYRVQPYELEKLQNQMIDLIKNPQLFNDWFGKHITIPMHELNILPVEPTYDLDEFKALLKSGAKLHRVPSIRIVKIENAGYIHGKKIPLPIEVIDLLCQSETLSYDQLHHEETLKVMLHFVNCGFWYFQDQE
ncbi:MULTISPECIES: cupin domain-containing protein [unclassified Gilliamella]|uniref:ribosomal protein uL16 3-hydroxylase n=1 Tax=unclassified Gilliamella TaxID=2685620 RepID=UPI001C6A38EE|nr:MULTISPECIES: cupin domain-containing protein [unclassified Gilliamella]MCX8600657.1 cupin domain-containing protein [Gilliamella sp. B3722]MCX8609197.1 cupin domain-containing protein [Gilliamella sp. B3771]MCX8609874.1 cupin domain-containing protein [Gilliamella sp. B3891]MCX8612036.1 cupin domain-containing protein [Gilliamella sp. B3773]MCX8615540.1 cupin domain-containing protein [Gilliamella sp. B3770]